MSRLLIDHTTTYTYRRPVAFGRHRLVLRPREGHDLQIERMTLDITPLHRLVWVRDVYNNSVAIVDFVEEADRLEFRSTVTLRRSLPFPLHDDSRPWHAPLPIVYAEFELPIVFAYQTCTHQEDRATVANWVQSLPDVTAATDAETLLMALCTRIKSQVKYQRREAKGVQTPAQTLQLASGSCRDVATLMMEAARSLGLAARFVSGYLDCPAAEAGRAAMHAWTEIYLPTLGWRGFDPSIGEATSLKHIVVAVSHHPRGVMPISGMYTGASGDYVDMEVSVKIERMAGEGAG